MKSKSSFIHIVLSTIFSLVFLLPSESNGQCVSCNGGAPPANDACTGAVNLGSLNAPLICPLGTGTPQTFSGTTVCANAEFPYGYIIGCQTGGDMAAPAADVWYRFQITGTVLNVQVASSLRGVSVGLWQDPGTGCDDLVARNCAQTTTGGNITASFTSLNPGVYYLQISGADTLDQCSFSLTLTNNDDCTACIQQNNLTVSPPPVNGRYQAGTTVTFTYRVLDYNQTATNWIHGIVPHFGNGWNLASLSGQVPSQSCDPVNGVWVWFNGTVTGSFRPISDGPGFFFESTLGCPATCNSNDPGDNYGDQGVNGDPLVGAVCQLTFQWTITTLASCSPGADNLNIEIFNYGDSETGSWTSAACETDPNYRFFAQLFCCDSSIVTTENVSCFGGNDGSCTVLGQGFPPYDYELLDLSGNVLQSQLGDSTNHTFNGLTSGLYDVRTTDENNCSTIQRIFIGQAAEIIITSDITNVLCNGDSNGSIEARVFGGTPPYSYQWDDANAQATVIASDLPAGTYNVTVTDSSNCEASLSFDVTEPQPFVGVFSIVNIPCAGGTGTAVLLMSGGTVPYSYSWSTGDTTQTIQVNVAGTYSCTATDANLCTFVDSVVISGGQSVANIIVDVQICEGDSLLAGGEYQTESGTYYDSLLTTEGCDSVIETRLQVLANLFTPISASICQGDSFLAGGGFQTESGIYYDTLSSTSGCDSIIETSLTVDAVITDSITASICDGESYFAGGSFQTQPGTYYDTFSTTTGCDSILVTELVVLPVTTGNEQVSICKGESYFVGGDFQTESGTYSDTLVGSNGCDSILTTELSVLPLSADTVQVSICESESYFVGGDFQTESGTYTDTLVGSNGCDSILTTELAVLPLSFETVQVSICEGESYFVGGDFQTESGGYTDTLVGSNGCDSILTTELTVLPLSFETVQVSICEGESYFVGGDFQTEPGTYSDTLVGSNGCDSILTTELTVLTLSFETFQVSICEGESYFVGGDFQTESGTYSDTLVSSNGCDSILTTELTVLPLSSETVQVSICEGESYFVGGDFQTEPGTYSDTLVGSNGCDSILTTELIVIPTSLGNTQVSICFGDSVLAGGGFQTEKGFYVDTLISASGCDSILTTEVIVIPQSLGNTLVSICEGDSYFVGGADQTDPGFYMDTLSGAASTGCDSILTTELIVIPPVFGSTSISICEGDSYFVGGADQTEAGFYSDTLIAASGCDSILTTELVVIPPSQGNTQASICEGDSYFVGGGDQTEAGFYVDTLLGAASNGCDSILTTELIVIPIAFGNSTATICEGESYFVGGDFQTESGFYTDTLVGSNGCDSILTTQLNVLPNSSSNQDVDICDGESFFAGGSFQTASGTYYDTLIAGNGCDSIVITNLTVGAPLEVNFDVNELTCDCFEQGNTNGEPCALDFAGLAHGAIVGGYFADLGVTITANANSTFPNKLMVFNSNLTNTADPDLQAGIGNIVVFPMNITDSNNDGIVDSPNDQGAGGTITFTFDDIRTVFGLTLVDNDRNGGTIKAYDANNNLIATVNTPSGADGSVQDITLNIPGVKKLEVIYADSRGIANIRFSCPPQTCEQDLSGYAHGQIVTGQEIAPGVVVTGTTYSPTQFPNAVAIFNSNVTGSLDPDLEVGIGNILILPEYLTDANGNGNIDDPSDSPDGGKMTFTFDRDRTVYKVTLVDNDRNNGTIKAFDANNALLLSVPTPSGAGSSIITYNLNVSGVRRLDITYWDSRGVTGLMLDCPPVNCCDGNVTANAAGGFPPYQYSWSTGSADAYSGDSLCVGTYYVTVTDALGCSTNDSVSLVRADVTTAMAEICEGDSIFLEGAFQTNAGFYYDTLGVTDSCFQILKTELTILLPSLASQQAQICQGDSFLAGGAYQTESGTYIDVFVAANGCDSILTTELTVFPASVMLTDAEICEGESYFAGGDFQTESGIYFDTLTTSEGCDSIVQTTLSVIPVLTENIAVEICEGESYFAGGDFQTESGTYYDTLTSSAGCDSVVTTTLFVLTVLTENIVAEICEGESYFVGGDFQTESGTYYDTLTSSTGCDSIVETNLSVLPAPVISINAQICEGDSFLAGGAFQTESGIYYDTLTTSGGCDSIIETTLSVLTVLTENVFVEICDGESYFAGGDFQTESGSYFDTLIASSGCDSIVVTDLTVLPATITSVDPQICQGDSFFVGGAFQTESGVYVDSFITSGGCDSIVETTLSVLSELIENVTAEICEGESFFAGGNFQTESGTYNDTLLASSGCDSIVVTELTVNPVYQIPQQTEICAGDSFFVGGAYQTESGIYIDSFTSEFGCDSIVTTDLMVLQMIVNIQDVSICQGDSFLAGGEYQTTAGVYFDTITAAGGCDSISVTNLSVLPTTATNQQVTICEGDSVFAGGEFQTEAGTYLDTLVSSAGCDSIVITVLTVSQQINITIESQSDASCFGSEDGEISISVDGGEEPYDLFWSTGQVQQGVNSSTSVGITGLAEGSYSVIVTDDAGCSATAGFSIAEPGPLALGAVTTPVTCNGGSDGTIDLTVFGGTPPYSYLWSTGDSTEDIADRPAGFDTVVVTDAGGCMATVIVEVMGPNAVPNTVVEVEICEGESYFAGGEFQTESGAYLDTLANVEGCDSIIVTELTVLPASSTIVLVGICQGESYFAGGDFQTESGTYYDSLSGVNGCDSIIVTELMVSPELGAVIQAQICQGQSYFAGGAFQTTSGTYYDTLSSASGCDSIVTTELTVNLELRTNVQEVICEGDSFLVGGGYQTIAGIYHDSLTASGGCDSLVITDLVVNAARFTSIDAQICDGDSLFAGGEYQTVAGLYYDTVQTTAGCDSILEWNITILQPAESTVQISICDGEFYFAGGGFQNQSGTYYDTVLSSSGCDSIVATELTVNPNKLTGIEALICEGDSVLAGGAYQTESGLYYDSLQTAAGCDSILEWDVIVIPAVGDTIDASICDGESYFAGGSFQDQSGIYYDTLLNTLGCDSIVTTVLSVNPNKMTGIEALICEGDSVLAGGAYQTEEGTYYDTLQTAAGCDSVLIWDVFVLPASSDTVDATICEGEFYFAGGGFQTQSGTYFDTLTNSFGCDSVVVTNLTVLLLPSPSFVTEEICPGDSIFLGGAYQTQAGEYVDTFVSSNGCDSLVTTQLTIRSSIALSGLQTPLSCNGVPDGAIDLFVIGGMAPYSYSWSPSGDTTQDISGLFAGLHTVVVTDANGCRATNITQVNEPDSLAVTSDITNETSPGANDGAIDLTVSGGTAPYFYLWSNGDTTQDLTGLSAGTYSVTISDNNGCSISASFDILLQQLRSIRPEFQVSVHPNPFSDVLLVELESNKAGNGLIKLRDLVGRTVVMERIEINLGANKYELRIDQRISTATYLLEVATSDGNQRVLKAVMKE